jgi:hypothetical protein
MRAGFLLRGRLVLTSDMERRDFLGVDGSIPVDAGGPGYGVPGAVLTSEPIRGVS